MKVLVVGGAGYIGSHMVRQLGVAGHDVTVLDNLSTGHADSVLHGTLVRADTEDEAALDRLFAAAKFDLVMHFAAASQAAESVSDPGKYYRNNVAGTLKLLDAMIRYDVLRLVFSSTAAIYGSPEYTPIDEDHPRRPINPYGASKLMVETVLADYDRAHGLRSTSLRYFNAAGADPDGRLGERHEPETHLIPIVLQAASGRRESVTVFGADYDTPDGTCIRDYVHVADLCNAHLLAAERLLDGSASAAYNLGNGDGYSVRQVIEAAHAVTGRNIPVREGPRRAGDPARLIADSRRAHAELGWRPRHAELPTIIRHAWAWESGRGAGAVADRMPG